MAPSPSTTRQGRSPDPTTSRWPSASASPCDDAEFWSSTGKRVAGRNLVFSIFCEHIGFSVWTLWSVLVLFLGPDYHIDPAQKFTLTAVPALFGSALRLPYTSPWPSSAAGTGRSSAPPCCWSRPSPRLS